MAPQDDDYSPPSTFSPAKTTPLRQGAEAPQRFSSKSKSISLIRRAQNPDTIRSGGVSRGFDDEDGEVTSREELDMAIEARAVFESLMTLRAGGHRNVSSP
ncbi:OLC1v1013276C1 [Oldenlandia corymbosa var. corymbosa]|uniref:OLC1v1013276C1 n=1 Tax=Oldenlandia corymbosa var. corymbosa TaxID=529605 RepID=A0AAV1E1H9_OLDCO|nr:OLC1v1013276C1 [Oldenlandia corymbosa var. corymbosa]